MSPFGEQTHVQRGAQLLAWYMGQWGGGLNDDDASVMLVTDVLAYSRAEGESPGHLRRRAGVADVPQPRGG